MTLYVARCQHNSQRYDIGSNVCLQAISLMTPRKQERIDVIECFPREAQLPDWLKGTPTLVDDYDSIHTGENAVHAILTLLSQTQEPSNSTRRPPVAEMTSAFTSAKVSMRDDTAPPEATSSLDAVWQTPVAEDTEDPSIYEMPKKITQEDYSKALQARKSTISTPQETVPMLQPMKDV